MAQTQSPTNLGYVAMVNRAIGATPAAWSHIACAKATFVADEAFSQFGASGANECNENGFARAAATMTAVQTTIAGDTIQATHQFTCVTAAETVYGFAVYNSATLGAGDPLLSCLFAAAQALEVDDKITCTGKCQLKKGV